MISRNACDIAQAAMKRVGLHILEPEQASSSTIRTSSATAIPCWLSRSVPRRTGRAARIVMAQARHCFEDLSGAGRQGGFDKCITGRRAAARRLAAAVRVAYPFAVTETLAC